MLPSAHGQALPADTLRADSTAGATPAALPDTGRFQRPVMGYEEQQQWRRQIDATQDARDTTASTQVNGVSLGGLVLNETSSTIGRDFYDVFYSRWQPPQNAANYTIRITEQYAPSLGSQVVVKVDETTLFRSYLQPNFEQIRTAALRALARTQQYLKRQYEPREVY